jgi:hypothetical protein
MTSRDSKLCFNFSLRFYPLFYQYFILFIFVCCKYGTNKGKQRVHCSFIPFPSRFGARPHSFDPPGRAPVRALSFGPPPPRERGKEQDRYAPLVSPLHRPCLRSHTGHANAGRRRTTRGQAPPPAVPNLVHAHTGGHAGGFAPSPSYNPGPTYAQAGTQTQDDAGRCGDKPPPPPFAPASSKRRQGL